MSYPAVLNSANEAAVNLFLSGRIGFLSIADIIEEQLQRHVPEEINEPEQVIELDKRINSEIGNVFSQHKQWHS
jgi:1-deoxy-D-xylulose-5-phosphate reductoisomerase